MPTEKKSRRQIEFGDYQTPASLARDVCALLARRGVRPASIVEPSCGRGSILSAALDRFTKCQEAVGLDVNEAYLAATAEAAQQRSAGMNIRLVHDDFFKVDWDELLRGIPEPVLVIGNPPWVTNSELGSLASANLPEKCNVENRKGLDAMTGKSNFDISEWMLSALVDALSQRRGTLAMLCKTSVARKVLRYAWQKCINVNRAEVYLIDADKHFHVSVDACLLVCHFENEERGADCEVFDSLEAANPAQRFGFRDNHLIADLTLYDRWRHLHGRGIYRWRSGIKHDSARIMELRKTGTRFCNGLSESVELEEDFVFPMLKSSDLGRASAAPRRWMLVPQRAVGDDTQSIEHLAPRTWDYLSRHVDQLDRRGSSIYKGRPRFPVFGVGPYSFTPWKVAISGFYKRLNFQIVGPFEGKPVVLDDTRYFVACQDQCEAECVASLLNSSPAREFYGAFVFWDAKRPITVDLLSRLDLYALAQELGRHDDLANCLALRSESLAGLSPDFRQGSLFD